MDLNIRPILATLVRNWTGAALVAAQVALTLAVLVNAIQVTRERIHKMDRPTGIDVENIFVILSEGVTARFVAAASVRDDLAYLRSLSGVLAATSINATPLSSEQSQIGVMLRGGDQQHGIRTNYYEVDEGALRALGLQLTAGKMFVHEEMLPARSTDGPPVPASEVIITQALADALYPGVNAVGKTLYDVFGYLAQPATIIGVVARMQGSVTRADSVERVVMAPRLPVLDNPGAQYIVRTLPKHRDALMRVVANHLRLSDPNRIITWVRPLTFFRDRSYRADRNMKVFLIAAITLLALITCVGAYGLATFNVRRRTRQVGIRRALGAQRIEVAAYFLVENGLITIVGLLCGTVLALLISTWLTTHYGLPRLDPRYLLVGSALLWLVGQLAAAYPAYLASAIQPAIATRDV
jgi:putative ABC transport system permease protein